MRILFILLFLTLSLSAQESVTWHKDVNKAITIATATKKPLLVVLR